MRQAPLVEKFTIVALAFGDSGWPLLVSCNWTRVGREVSILGGLNGKTVIFCTFHVMPQGASFPVRGGWWLVRGGNSSFISPMHAFQDC